MSFRTEIIITCDEVRLWFGKLRYQTGNRFRIAWWAGMQGRTSHLSVSGSFLSRLQRNNEHCAPHLTQRRSKGQAAFTVLRDVSCQECEMSRSLKTTTNHIFEVLLIAVSINPGAYALTVILCFTSSSAI